MWDDTLSKSVASGSSYPYLEEHSREEGAVTSRIWKELPAWTCVLQSRGTDICSEHVGRDLREKLLRSHSPPPVLLQGAPFA